MKYREKRVERLVAKYITGNILEPHDLGETKRIPVLGRTGPDLTPWPHYHVAVDVKSRKAIPQVYRLRDGQVIRFDDHIGVRLENFERLFDVENTGNRYASKTVTRWLDHMDDWVQLVLPTGIAAIVLHWPRTHIKHATLVIKNSQRSVLHDRHASINHS